MKKVVVKNSRKSVYKAERTTKKIKGIYLHTDINIINFYASNNMVSKYIYINIYKHKI